MASVTCSLNITIPSTVIVTWSHNNLIADPNQITRIGNTTTLLIGNPQPSDAGIYQCVFDDTSGSGWILHRNIRLITQGMVCTYIATLGMFI